MLKVRVIPTLLWKDFGLVKGVAFDSSRRVGPIVPAVRVYTRREVDELILLDITATRDGRAPDLELIAQVADETTVPLTVGGGVRSEHHVAKMLEAGADKISLNSAAFEEPALIERCAHRFGAQCVVVSIDFRSTPVGPRCFSRSGSSATGREPREWARTVESAGAGEILLTAIDRDGTMQGYEIEVLADVAAAVGIPVIASGGAGGPDHMALAVQQGGAAAVAAASIFHFTEQTPQEMKDHLEANGVAVRQATRRDDE